MDTNTPPVILSFSVLDPSGRGGLQADIEAAASLGCHCAPIATALCASGMTEASDTVPIDSTLLIEQARSVLEEMNVKAFKVGYTGSVANTEAIHTIVKDYPHLPLIVHPAFNLWDPSHAEQSDLPAAISSLLLPLSEVGVLSLIDAHTLVKESDTIDATAQCITSNGCQYLLINEQSPTKQQYKAVLYNQGGLVKDYNWQQIPPFCHGSASTLTSAIASLRAHDCPPVAAVEQAQNYTWQAVSASRQLGFNKSTPHRFFWADKNIDVPSKMPSSSKTH